MRSVAKNTGSDILDTMGRSSRIGLSSIQAQLRESYSQIGCEISRLNKISNTIRRASKESQFRKATEFRITDDDGNDIESFLSDVFEHHINDRFPEIGENIRRRLVRAMILRRKRILYRRHRQGSVAIQPQEYIPKTSITLPLAPQTTTPVSSNATQDNGKEAFISEPKLSPSVVQSATTLDPEKFKKASLTPSTVSASKTIALNDHEYVVFPPNPGLATRRKYEQLISVREAEYKKEVELNGITAEGLLRFENLKKADLERVGEIACPYCLYALPAEVILSDQKWM